MSPTSDSERLYSITDLARELAITPRAIRFYESKALIAPQRAGANRIYTHRDRARLLIILRGKRLGFSLSGIKSFLDLYDADPQQESQLRHLLKGVRRRIEQLETQKRDLELTLDELCEMEAQTIEALADLDADAAKPKATPVSDADENDLTEDD
jgi:DNA-binding transcriptional MerR regulator